MLLWYVIWYIIRGPLSLLGALALIPLVLFLFGVLSLFHYLKIIPKSQWEIQDEQYERLQAGKEVDVVSGEAV